MADRVRCRVQDAHVRPDQRDTLTDLIHKMFERRHHDYVAGPETDWLTMELVQSLRRESTVYKKELSTEMEGPLPFALGYFQLRDDELRLTTDTIPANVEPEVFVRFLSEFVRPGGRFWFGADEEGEGWEIRGEDEVVRIDTVESG